MSRTMPRWLMPQGTTDEEYERLRSESIRLDPFHPMNRKKLIQPQQQQGPQQPGYNPTNSYMGQGQQQQGGPQDIMSYLRALLSGNKGY